MRSNWATPVQTGNIAPLLLDISHPKALLLLNIRASQRRVTGMKHFLPLLAFAALFLVQSPAHAADCYADYKAKQDSPLRLHYGVIEISTCSANQAAAEASARLQAAGWTLLNVISVFGPEGLQERKADAGSYYLRF